MFLSDCCVMCACLCMHQLIINNFFKHYTHNRRESLRGNLSNHEFLITLFIISRNM